MSVSTSPQPASIAAIRLGAMGDILHTLPAVASLKRSFPESQVTWVIAPKWAPLLEGNPYVDAVLPFDRRNWKDLLPSIRRLNRLRPTLAVDFHLGARPRARLDRQSLARPDRRGDTALSHTPTSPIRVDGVSLRKD